METGETVYPICQPMLMNHQTKEAKDEVEDGEDETGAAVEVSQKDTIMTRVLTMGVVGTKADLVEEIIEVEKEGTVV